jgi:uncharacterized RDD family membrane protein YckC
MTDANPYAAPKTDVSAAAPAAEANLVDASLGRRFLNLIIDMLVRFVLSILVAVVSTVLGLGPPTFGRALLGAFATIFFYYFLCEVLFGWTVGKLITGTRVVTNDGGKPSALQVVGRTAARFVPFEPFSILGNSPTAWHDRWSGTRVIRRLR